MRFPSSSDTNQTFILLGRYTTARVRADPKVSGRAELLHLPQVELVAKIAARNGAADHVTDAEAARDFQVDSLGAVVMDLGRRAYAHFGSRKEAGYLRLFPQAPSAIALLPERDRGAVFPAWVKEWQSKETPAPLAPEVKRLAESWKAVQAADAAVQDAERALERARAAEGEARTAWLAGYRRIHAQLTDQFPTDKRHVERFFRSPASSRGKKPAAPGGQEAGEAEQGGFAEGAGAAEG